MSLSEANRKLIERLQQEDPQGFYRAASMRTPATLERLLNAARTEERALVIERAEQACRYALKHQNFEDDGEGNRYREGWEIAAEVCEGAIRPHVERHCGSARTESPASPGGVEREAAVLGEQVRNALLDEPCVYETGVADKLLELPEAYRNAIRFVSSAEMGLLLQGGKHGRS